MAVREFVLPNGPCDYLLFVGGNLQAALEAFQSVAEELAVPQAHERG